MEHEEIRNAVRRYAREQLAPHAARWDRDKEFPAEALKRPATRISTAILMYSFGGLRREGANETELLPAGITEADLMAICVGPDLDSTTVQACLKQLKEHCLYLHFDGVRYCFKKDPNITLLVE